MVARRTLRWLTAVCALGLVVWILLPQVASAATSSGSACATTAPAQSEASPVAGSPCWVDVSPYPFGADGLPVDPANDDSDACAENTPGPKWGGDYVSTTQNPCYEQVTSMAFRAWNRGLAATEEVNGNKGNNAYGVWLYNGNSWYPDPTFPGSSSCPGSTILWAGKLDYWLIGSPAANSTTGSSGPETTLCHFDGANIVWDVLTLPAATVAQLPLVNGTRFGGITSGTCLAWNDCWFFGTDGIRVHWDGEELSDESDQVTDSPWLAGTFTAAASATTSGGTPTIVAVNDGQYEMPYVEPYGQTVLEELIPDEPDGASGPLAYGLSGQLLSPLGSFPSFNTTSGGATVATTRFDAASTDSSGATWLAGNPDYLTNHDTAAQAPLVRVNPDGAEICSAGNFVFDGNGADTGQGYEWTSVGVDPDGNLLAGGSWASLLQPVASAASSSSGVGAGTSPEAVAQAQEPVLFQGGCGSNASGSVTDTAAAPAGIEFRIPDPLSSQQTTADKVPADEGGAVTAVAASASNDAWAATSSGDWYYQPTVNGVLTTVGGVQRPHLYLYTDGQTPDAPAGDDNETRPSLFTLSPPVYQVSPATIVTESVTKTLTKKAKRKSVKLKPAVYALHTHLVHHAGKYTLRLTFKVRRPVTLGLAALHGKRIVARTPLERFKKHTGELSVRIKRSAWPTGLKLLTPKAPKKR